MPVEPAGSPPSYSTAVGSGENSASPPGVSITTPAGENLDPEAPAAAAGFQSQNPFKDSQQRPGHNRVASDSSYVSGISDDDGLNTGNLEEDERRSMDDERRDLPEGWVRCFDPKTMHHFYVDTETKRSTWFHPYDDPEYLRSLPASHPANPHSHEAQAIRKRSEDEKTLAQKASGIQNGDKGVSSSIGGSRSHGAVGEPARDRNVINGGDEHERNWFQRKKDKLIGTKEERQKAKEEKRRIKAERQEQMMKEQAEYARRRQELINRQLNDPMIAQYYNSDPYAYPAPMGAYSRVGGMYDNPYGYGYGGGYGRRYGYGYGPYGGGYGGGGIGMGMGMGMLGGLAGGILLGDAIGGGF